MTSALSATCPTCQEAIGDNDIVCAQCGAEIRQTPRGGLAPLILPGNPALSADMFRGPKSRLPAIAAVAAGVAAVAAVIFSRPAEDPEPLSIPPALRAEPAPVLGDTALSTALPTTVAAVTDLMTAPAPANAVTPTLPERLPSAAARTAGVSIPSTAPSAASRTAARLAATVPTKPTASPSIPLVGAKAVPVFSLAPLVSDSLRQGELLQLRWTIVDRATQRPMTTPIEFTSSNEQVAIVDRRRGIVTAINPGRVRILVDAAAAGEAAVSLTVRAPVRAPVAAAASSAPAPQPIARPPATVEPSTRTATLANTASASTPTSVSTVPPRASARVEMLNDTDLRAAVDRFISDVRMNGARNAELMAFLADGDGHRVALQSGPAVISSSTYTSRIMFEINLRKYDSGSRPLTRISTISMDLEKRDGNISSSAISISALRRP